MKLNIIPLIVFVLNKEKEVKTTVTKFAWFPVYIDHEIRWLEKVTYNKKRISQNKWIKTKFIN